MRGPRWAALPGEGAAMGIAGTSRIGASRIGISRIGLSKARFAVLPAIAIAGCTIWMMLPQASDAESSSSEVSRIAQNPSENDGPVTPTQAILSNDTSPVQLLDAPPETAAPEKPPIDGLKISSQSWRRGGLGSKALVTFTLRNANDYAVKDIEIACTFKRRDGSHLTDRRRVISDTVSMKSRKRYAGMLVGFVNVNANKAKCSLVTANRI
jgi:hypothetical protein